MRDVLGKTLQIQLLTDSEPLFNILIRNSSITVKRLMIHVKAEREAYIDARKIDDIICIRGNYNLSDAMNKAANLQQT